MSRDLTVADLILDPKAAEPRIRDIDIAEALEFERPRDIRKLIDRNLPELHKHGLICATVAQNTDTKGRGRPSMEYWLNQDQALLRTAPLLETEDGEPCELVASDAKDWARERIAELAARGIHLTRGAPG